MIPFLLSGIVYGAAAGISPGPLLALVIRESFTYDVRAGIAAALAPLLTDLPIVTLSLLVLSALSGNTVVPAVLSFAGGAFVAYLGIDTLTTRPKPVDPSTPRSGSFWRAVLTNALSPHPYMFWLLVGAPTTLKAAESGTGEAVAFISGFYLLLVGTKITVAVLAYLQQVRPDLVDQFRDGAGRVLDRARQP